VETELFTDVSEGRVGFVAQRGHMRYMFETQEEAVAKFHALRVQREEAVCPVLQ
jgi:hypothetical protein